MRQVMVRYRVKADQAARNEELVAPRRGLTRRAAIVDHARMPSAEDLETITIAAPRGRLTATFAPRAGMVCCSLEHEGQELLARLAGLAAYAERGSTMGIPLLHPWANRLGASAYGLPPHRVELDAPVARDLVRRDAGGLPIHGVIGARLPWRVIEGVEGGSALRAQMQWDSPDLLSVFPFPHTLELRVGLGDGALTYETILSAKADSHVPVSYGQHPYLTLTGAGRESWQVELPQMRGLALDERGIPTGETTTLEARSLSLGDSDWDHAFDSLADGAAFSVSDGARAVTVEFLRGYPCAQVFAPSGEEFICFEPMTAPTNALLTGDGLRTVPPGGEFHSVFRISVSPEA
ncbi:MAG TPA: aldose 1-epimerase [Solirubrobacteraceae bacterium]